jgi:hypothetical protein
VGEGDGYLAHTAIAGMLDQHAGTHGIAIERADREVTEALELLSWQLVALDQIGE